MLRKVDLSRVSFSAYDSRNKNSFFKDCTNCENHMTDQELIDNLTISDTDMQTIIVDLTVDMDQIVAGLTVDMDSILDSLTPCLNTDYLKAHQ